MLLSRTLRIDNASVRGLVVTLPEQPAPDEPDKPLWVEPPLEVVVKDFSLIDGRIVKGGEVLFAVKQLSIAARWSREELRIDRLTLLPGDIAGRLTCRAASRPAASWSAARSTHGGGRSWFLRSTPDWSSLPKANCISTARPLPTR